MNIIHPDCFTTPEDATKRVWIYTSYRAFPLLCFDGVVEISRFQRVKTKALENAVSIYFHLRQLLAVVRLSDAVGGRDNAFSAFYSPRCIITPQN